ncbi:MAG TPA: serine/threonine-protein kinase [Planctomycetaceae bacterium]
MTEIGSGKLTFDMAHHAWTILSGRVEAFVDAWEHAAEPPSPREFLPADPLPVRRMTLVELLKVDLEYRWVHRQLPRTIEDYVADFPELAGDVPADLIYEEYHIRSRAGDQVSPQDYLDRFPQRAAELNQLFIQNATKVSTSLRGGSREKLHVIQAGERLDDFDLLALVGEGAFARVFLARQISMQRLVALKVSADQGHEPQTLAQLDHEHIVRVFDQRAVPGRKLRLLYMQYVAGGTLEDVVEIVRQTPPHERTGMTLVKAIDAALLRRGETRTDSDLQQHLAHRQWPEVVCALGAKLANALDHAHRQGVLHRDIKPANILVTAAGSPKLADFNIGFCSKTAGATPAAYFGGTAGYMSPEQLEACNPAHDRQPDSLDGRSDLYALAVVLWELLTGSRPFIDEHLAAGWGATLAAMTARRHAGVDRQLAARASRNWPAGLGEILLRCLAPDREQRPAHGNHLARQLELCLAPQAHKLLAPPVQNWRWLARRFPVVCVLAATVIPNLFAAVFNYYYNRREIIDRLPHYQQAFQQIQATINAIAFPVGIFLVFWFMRPIAAALHRGQNDAPLASEALHALRRSCLRLGPLAAGLCLTLWLIAAPAYPIALQWEVGSVPPADCIHFVASLTLCGLIAAAYPFFTVACLSVCSFYPAFVRIESMSHDDLEPLLRLGRSSGLYLVVAATVPMLSVVILVAIDSHARLAMGLLAAAGLVGFGLAFLLFRTLQSDLGALGLIAKK